MIGVLVNVATVLVGSLIGLLLKKGIPQKVTDAVMIGIGGCTMYIGIDGALKGENVLVVIGAMVLGAIVGTLIDIDRYLNKAGELAETKFAGKNGEGSIAQGFVTGSLLFCVGSMTVVGSLNAGISGDNEMLFTKSLLDFVSSMMLSASLGIGVMLSAGFVLVAQGGLVLLAQIIAPVLTEAAIADMTCVGSIMILFIGFNLTRLGKFKVANYLPALVFAPLLSAFAAWITKAVANLIP